MEWNLIKIVWLYFKKKKAYRIMNNIGKAAEYMEQNGGEPTTLVVGKKTMEYLRLVDSFDDYAKRNRKVVGRVYGLKIVEDPDVEKWAAYVV